jgi:hypothetical protein
MINTMVMRKRIFACTAILLLVSIAATHAKTYSSKANGNWNSSSTWNPSGVPGKNDDVTINHTVTLTRNEKVKYLKINSNGVLQGNYELQFWNNGSLEVDGEMNIKTIDLHNAGLTFTVNATGDISLSGDLDINNNTITCNGTIQVGGTLNSGNITGTGAVQAATYSTGTVFGSTPTNGVTYYGQSWIGGTTGAEQSWETATNWASGSIPVSTSVVKIGTGTTVPIISSNAECGDLVLESGANLIIYPLSSLTINGDATNNGTITLKSTSSGTGSLIENGTIINNGHIYVERYLSAGGYHYVSSPVNNAAISSLNDAYYVFSYDETNTDQDRNVGWTTATTNLTNGQGYAVYYTTATTDTFTGDLNNGTINITATRTASGSSATPSPDGWHILGNPYPSAISANSFIAANPDLTGTLYFWSDDGTNGTGFTTADYATYTLAGGVGSSGGGQSTAPDGKIPVSQGFFAQVKSGVSSTNVTFTNAMRLANTTQFFVPRFEIPEFRLDLSDSKGNQNEILLSFPEDATEAFDQNYDGIKMQGNPNLSFFSLLDEHELIIQALPPITKNVSVPLGYYVDVAGELNMERFELKNFNDEVRVYLEDKLTGDRIDLLNNPSYRFYSEKGKFDDRFVLHFEYLMVNTTGVELDEENEEIEAHAFNQCIHISNPLMLEGDIIVYNSIGQKVQTAQLMKSRSQEISLKDQKGVVILKISTESDEFSKKLYID